MSHTTSVFLLCYRTAFSCFCETGIMWRQCAIHSYRLHVTWQGPPRRHCFQTWGHLCLNWAPTWQPWHFQVRQNKSRHNTAFFEIKYCFLNNVLFSAPRLFAPGFFPGRYCTSRFVSCTNRPSRVFFLNVISTLQSPHLCRETTYHCQHFCWLLYVHDNTMSRPYQYAFFTQTWHTGYRWNPIKRPGG